MAEEQTDLVFSYLIDSIGDIHGQFPELAAALASEFRVLDVICTPMATAANVVVTVLLTKGSVAAVPYRGAARS